MTAGALALPRRRSGAKYGALFALAFRSALQERTPILGRIGFFGVLLLIFSRLWTVVVEKDIALGLGVPELLWYLAITEWIALSLPWVFLHIENDVKTGDIAYQLPRPISYLGVCLARGSGEYAARLLVLAPVGMLFAGLMAGGLPGDARGLWLALPLGLGASLLSLVFVVLIGLCAVWLQDTSPLYWIWQKLGFVLGGLMLPLEIYPDWLRTLALASPFSSLLYGPARMAFGLDWEVASGVAIRMGVWLVVTTALLLWVYRRALRSLEINGG
jgi:ABC-2 type transport system permease protein